MSHGYLQNKCHGFEYVVATWAFIETFLLAGHRAGWASLVYVLKMEGIYKHLCQNTSYVHISLSTSSVNDSEASITENIDGNVTIFPLEGIHSGSVISTGCPEQDAMFELCMTIAAILSSPFNLLLSQVNFRHGIRTTRIISIFMLLAGTASFATISTDTPWLMFIGYISVSNGGVGLLQTNNQVSYMFKRHGSTVIGAVCGAFDASGVVFLGVKLAYEHGIPRSTSFIVIGVSCTLALISTFCLLPKDFIRPVQAREPLPIEMIASQNDNGAVMQNISEKTHLINDKRSTSIVDKVLRTLGKSSKGNSIDFKHETDMTVSPSSVAEMPKKQSVLLKYICSPLYVLLILWTSVNQLLFLMFIGSLNAWLGHVTHGVDRRAEAPINTVDGKSCAYFAPTVKFEYDLKNKCTSVTETGRLPGDDVSHFTNFVFYAMLTAPVFSILAGAAVDFLLWIQSDSRNEKAKLFYALAGPSTFTSIIGVLLCACVIAEKEEVTYIVGLIFVIHRAALYSYWGSFIRVMYPSEYFAGLYGIILVFCGTVTFLQYPLFLWCQRSMNGYRQVYTAFGFLTLSTLAQPIYLIYIGKKQSRESKLQSQAIN